MKHSIYETLDETNGFSHMDRNNTIDVHEMLSNYQNRIWFAALSFVKNYELADEVAEAVRNRVLSEEMNEHIMKNFDLNLSVIISDEAMKRIKESIANGNGKRSTMLS